MVKEFLVKKISLVHLLKSQGKEKLVQTLEESICSALYDKSNLGDFGSISSGKDLSKLKMKSYHHLLFERLEEATGDSACLLSDDEIISIIPTLFAGFLKSFCKQKNIRDKFQVDSKEVKEGDGANDANCETEPMDTEETDIEGLRPTKKLKTAVADSKVIEFSVFIRFHSIAWALNGSDDVKLKADCAMIRLLLKYDIYSLSAEGKRNCSFEKSWLETFLFSLVDQKGTRIGSAISQTVSIFSVVREMNFRLVEPHLPFLWSVIFSHSLKEDEKAICIDFACETMELYYRLRNMQSLMNSLMEGLVFANVDSNGSCVSFPPAIIVEKLVSLVCSLPSAQTIPLINSCFVDVVIKKVGVLLKALKCTSDKQERVGKRSKKDRKKSVCDISLKSCYTDLKSLAGIITILSQILLYLRIEHHNAENFAGIADRLYVKCISEYFASNAMEASLKKGNSSFFSASIFLLCSSVEYVKMTSMSVLLCGKRLSVSDAVGLEQRCEALIHQLQKILKNEIDGTMLYACITSYRCLLSAKSYLKSELFATKWSVDAFFSLMHHISKSWNMMKN